MLAHRGPVGTGAGERDLLRRGEEPRVGVANFLHDPFRKLPLQELDERSDGAGDPRDELAPPLLRRRTDGDFDPVEGGPHHLCPHLARFDGEIDDRPVFDIAPSPGEAICIVAVGLQIVAPRLPPDGFGDLPSLHVDGAQDRAGLLGLPGLLEGLLAALGHRNIGSEAVIAHGLFS